MKCHHKLFSRGLLIALLAMPAIASAQSANATAADQAYTRNDYVTALRLAQEEANAGDALAHHVMYHLYIDGKGIGKDEYKALDHVQKAVAGNLPHAYYDLAQMYKHKQAGLPKDLAKILEYTQVAASKNVPAAISIMAVRYDEGIGVPKNMYEALRLYRLAVQLGDKDAMVNLASVLYDGKGTTANPHEAVTLYRKAAELGEANAMYMLGHAYVDGKGIKQDLTQARHWLSRAVSGGAENARWLLTKVDRALQDTGRPQQAANTYTAPPRSNGPTLSDQVMATHKRQAQENCQAWSQGRVRECIRR